MRHLEFRTSFVWVVWLALCWALLVRDMGLLHTFTVFPRNIILSIAVMAMAFVYRGVSLSFQLGRRHVFWFCFFVSALVLANLSTIGESLTCDELYHAGMSALGIHAVEIISAHGDLGRWLANRPMPESAGLVSFAFCSLTGLVLWLVVALQKRVSHFRMGVIWGTGFVLTLGIAQLFRNFPLRQEMHPPLRLLPAFVAQTVFGLDDLSFRLVGVVFSAFAATCVASFVLGFRKHQKGNAFAGELWDLDYLMATVCGLLAVFVPPVLHASVIVQPSIYCFVVWIFVFVLTDRYLRVGNDEDVIAAGVCIGLGSLMRQNAMVLWPVVGLALLIRRPAIMVWIRSLLPGIWLLPFFGVLARSTHPAASNASPWNVWDAATSGKLFQILVNGTSLPWLAFSAVVTVWLLSNRAWRRVPGLLILVALVPAGFLYFTIWPYLSWLGRYQAEYLGAAIAVVVATAGAMWGRRKVIPLSMAALYLVAYSVHMNLTLNQDTYFAEWPQKRVTTESIFPYREALGFLHRQPGSEMFAWIGGVPVYGPYFLYLRGYSAAQVEKWKGMQGQFESMAERSSAAADLINGVKHAGFAYVVVQYGDKREYQHRSVWQNAAEGWVREAARRPDSGITLEHRFYGPFEGAIDIFAVK